MSGDPRNSKRQFGRYQALRRWGSGGMAEIYVARQTGAHGFDKLVALKVLRRELVSEDHLRQMFFAEARTGALLAHPNIVQTFDVGERRGHLYMAMEFVNGECLDKVAAALAKQGAPFPPQLAVAIVRNVADALHYAHTMHDLEGNLLHLVHRDVSPSNVMLSHDGTVKLLDFGIAKVASTQAQTKAGSIKGKLAYLSPEQARSEPLDARSDIFSLGVCLWQLLTGKVAFAAENSVSILTKITEEDLPMASAEGGPLDDDLDAIVSKAVQRNPDDRYPTAKAFGDALATFSNLHYSGFEPAELIRTIMREHFTQRSEKLKTLVASFATDPGNQPTLEDQGDDEPYGEEELAYSATLPGAGLDAEDSENRVEHLAMDTSALGRETMRVAPMGYVPPSRGPLIALFVVVLAVCGAAVWWFWPRAPEVQRITISSDPSGARVTINGKEKGRTPYELEAASGELLNVSVSMLGYRAFHQVLKVQDEAAHIAANLQKGEEFGTLVVVSAPSGANVSIDGLAIEWTTPVVVPRLWIGQEHMVVVTLDGHAPAVEKVVFESTGSKEVRVALEATEQGFLAAWCAPTPCDVHLNGRKVAQTPVDGYELSVAVPVSVQLIRDGKILKNENHTLHAGELWVVEHADKAKLPIAAVVEIPRSEPLSSLPITAHVPTKKPLSTIPSTSALHGGKTTTTPAHTGPRTTRLDETLDEPRPEPIDPPIVPNTAERKERPSDFVDPQPHEALPQHQVEPAEAPNGAPGRATASPPGPSARALGN